MADCFAIFEGGGAKGLAHVGALKAAESCNLNFLGVAGASAGAIIAALIAAGFKADELFTPTTLAAIAKATPAPVFAATDWIDILDAATWRGFKTIKSELANIPPARGSPGLGAAWRGWRFKRRWQKQVEAVLSRRGYFSTQNFELWLDRVLCDRIGMHSSGLQFDELYAAPNTIPLKVVAVDIEAQKLVTYSHLDSPSLPVAKAVAASISIPFFFAPTIVNGRAMVDGGLMSNFPAWLFEFERSLAPPFTRTYGFTLVEAEKPTRDADGSFSAALDYASSVVQTGIFGGQTLLNESVEFFQVVPVETTFGVLDFELSVEEKDALYAEGLRAAKDYFARQGVVDDQAVTAALMRLSDVLRTKIGQTLPALRANVILPVKESHLRVTYSYNMQGDADDRLLLSKNQTGAGEAIARCKSIVTDMRRIRRNGLIRGLSKYDSALVREDLISLISIPIFKADKDWGKEPGLRSPPRAVLSFDCNEDILSFFNRANIQEFFVYASIVIGRLLRGEPLQGAVQ